jgi:pimeloyl-[acyl-carrier protein] methyl ester esterase
VTLHVDRAGAGPDLVLLHGWGLHGGAWDEVLPLLSARFRTHVPDLPGHGHSAGVIAGSFDAAVDAVAGVVPQAAIVCGWSLGGLIAQRLAVRHPGRVRALVLVSTTPCFVQRRDWPHAMSEATLEEFAQGLSRDADATLARFVQLNALNGATSRAAMRAFTARLLARGRPPLAGLARALAWLREVDLRTDASRIGVPSVVLHGTRDMLAPVAAARWLAGAIGGASLVEIPDAAHLPFFTHRGAFAATLESVLA